MNERNKPVAAAELQKRIEKLQNAMAARGMDGVLVVQKTDLFYFSGTGQQGWLYVPVEGDPVLMVVKDYKRAQEESSLLNIEFIGSAKKIPGVLGEYGFVIPSLLGMELDVLPVNLFNLYCRIFDKAEVVDISTEIRLIRAVKSDFEIAKIKDAARLSDKLAAKVPDLLVAGKSEIELAGELEGYARSLGHQGIVRMRLWGSELFFGHLLSGPGAAVASYLASPTGGEGVSVLVAQGAGYRKIGKGEPVLVDYVFAKEGYLSDHARIFSIGEIADELKVAHEAMLEIQEIVKKLARPGVETGALYSEMIELAAGKGYADFFMGVGESRIRFTGHGLGLELDEFPFIAKGQKLTLAEGMVIALEPKVIFPGKGVVGIENTHLVAAEGLQPLTKYPDIIQVV